jgi:hypothetical protein
MHGKINAALHLLDELDYNDKIRWFNKLFAVTDNCINELFT